jgi:hypothetical protein
MDSRGDAEISSLWRRRILHVNATHTITVWHTRSVPPRESNFVIPDTPAAAPASLTDLRGAKLYQPAQFPPISSWPGLTRPSRFAWKIRGFPDGRLGGR